MNNIAINIHDMVRGVVLNPPDWLARGLHDHLGRFITGDEISADPDFIIRPESSRKILDLVSIVPGPQARFGCVMKEEKRGVFILHRDKPDVGIYPEHPVVVSCVGGKRAMRRIHGMILLAIDLVLRRKKGILFHGLCLSRAGRTVLIYGVRGSRKTMLGLTLLRDGWDYIADDKLILCDGDAYVFEDVLRIRDHHILDMPWLARETAIRGGTVSAEFRDILRRAGSAIAPKRYITPWHRKWDRQQAVSGQKLFPGAEILESCRPEVLIHLQPSDHFALQAFDDHEFKVAAAVQRMRFHEMYPIEDLLVAFCGTNPPALEDILEHNLGAVDIRQLEYDSQTALNKMAGEVEKSIKQA